MMTKSRLKLEAALDLKAVPGIPLTNQGSKQSCELPSLLRWLTILDCKLTPVQTGSLT